MREPFTRRSRHGSFVSQFRFRRSNRRRIRASSEPRAGRLHRGLAALRAAKKDISEEEDNAYAQGLRAKALKHIENALKHTEEGVAAAEKAS